jgi:A/G-specific adenine glycosylase
LRARIPDCESVPGLRTRFVVDAKTRSHECERCAHECARHIGLRAIEPRAQGQVDIGLRAFEPRKPITIETLQTANAASIRRAILAWYTRSKRDLPWRHTTDPYAIWISEVMLQQTRVAAVLPYYQRFLKRFPAVQDLARAREEDVLAKWSGLGYYSRARNLRKAAIKITEAGAFPSGYEGIRALPGIGNYTAAAVASIAFKLPHAAIDGNALRVLSRLVGEPGDIGARSTRDRLEAVADRLLDRKRPGDFNQAVMELGATICLPKLPDCVKCPVSKECVAFQTGTQNRYPLKLRKAQREEASETIFYIERGEQILFWRREASSKRLAGFWELPGPTELKHAAREKMVGEFRHTIVNTTYRFKVVRASIRTIPSGLVWQPKRFLHELPLSTTAKKALRCLGVHETGAETSKVAGAGRIY